MDAQYDHKKVEERVAKFWQDKNVYSFDKDSAKPIYSIDTPPPTVSGLIHMGHVYSYSQADFMARYKRMRGYNVFYPFGFDNNGLPTELLVEKNKGVVAERIGREKFVALVEEEVKKYGQMYRNVWSRVGISVDWNLLYSTISESVQKTSQFSFIELYKMGRAYRRETPSMWCPKCRTTVSQMELKDANLKSSFVTIRFAEGIDIATTRPELLPSCVAIFVNPNDKKNAAKVGKTVKVPLFGQEVKIIADEHVDPEKGTGIVMCCTFGDVTDIDWYRSYNLPLKLSIDENGRMLTGEYAGKKVNDARAGIIQELKDKGLVMAEKDIEHAVNTHERCDTEIEFLVKKQWFISYLDLKPKFLELGSQLKWVPEYMKVRYDNWVNGLKWDWGISRQRYYGVPFPVWYCKKCDEVKIAEAADLPVNPLSGTPKGSCAKCGSTEFVPESDVMDTWATSSLTPLINAGWGVNKEYSAKIYPLDMRPQAHDIISFWLFTSIVKGYLHTGKLPFKMVLISGHGLDPKGRPMHKSAGNIIEPVAVIDKYGADALRHWASTGGAGNDSSFQEKEVVRGLRLVNKLWNVSRFIDAVKGDGTAATNVVDRWILAKLMSLVKETTELMENYDYAEAKRRLDLFFFFMADNYLEFVKHRIYGKQDKSAVFTLRTVLLTVLKLYAPYLPYVTEDIYSSVYGKEASGASMHASSWPEPEARFYDADALAAGDDIQHIVAFIRQWKHNNGMALNAPLKSATISKMPAGAGEEIKGIMNIAALSTGQGDTPVPETDITVSITA